MPINQPVKPNRVSKDLVNETIPNRFKEVLVIDVDGTSLGVMSRGKALMIAEQKGLDLLCVAPNAKVPTCKIINYSKYRYEQQKRDRDAKKNQKVIKIKEVSFTPLISIHDLETKVNQSIKFLEKGMKLKVSVFLKGRMVTKLDAGIAVLNKFIDLIKEYGVVEKQPVLEGKNYFCFISPIKK